MKQTDTAEKKPIVLPCIAGLLWILLAYLFGVIAPVFADIYRDFNLAPGRSRFLSSFHWYWTMPLGFLVAGFLVWGSRHWTRKTNLKIDLIVIGLAILLFLMMFFFALFVPDIGLSQIQTKEKTVEQNPQGK